MSETKAKRLTGKLAVSFLWNNGTEQSDDYRVAPVAEGPGGCSYIALILRVDPAKPGDRITQPNRNTGIGGGNLGHCAAFSQVVKVDFAGAIGEVSVSGKYAISDGTDADWARLGEDRSEEKWNHLRRGKGRRSKASPKVL